MVLGMLQDSSTLLLGVLYRGLSEYIGLEGITSRLHLFQKMQTDHNIPVFIDYVTLCQNLLSYKAAHLWGF